MKVVRESTQKEQKREKESSRKSSTNVKDMILSINQSSLSPRCSFCVKALKMNSTRRYEQHRASQTLAPPPEQSSIFILLKFFYYCLKWCCISSVMNVGELLASGLVTNKKIVRWIWNNQEGVAWKLLKSLYHVWDFHHLNCLFNLLKLKF